MSIRRKAIALMATIALPLAPAVAAPARKAAAPATATVPADAPRLIVAIAVDQFSADLFAQYRRHYTGGLARLATGGVFPSGYQSHAATETCPGHSTILTGMRPAHTGIIANTWIDQSVARGKKAVYCAEDETQAAADPKDYVASVAHLLVPTLGERMKQRWPASRNVAVSGKDRGALMMGGHTIDQVYWWKGKGFATLEGRTLSPQAEAENASLAEVLKQGAPAMPLPEWCAGLDRAISVGTSEASGFTVGTGRFALAPGDAGAFRASPRLDRATIDLATELVDSLKLGKGAVPDILSVSLSATDYIGHATGTEGAEMCIQMQQLDLALGDFFTALDQRGIDYAVVLTADHGGFDLPERLNQQGLPQAQRAAKALLPEKLSEAIAPVLGLDAKGLVLSDGAFGDYWVNRALAPADKARVVAAVKQQLATNPQVAAVFSADELAAAPMPTGSPETWSLLQRARASFYAPRSGDFVVLLNRGVVPIVNPSPGGVATHGSAWDYDRRVPMLFWRRGMTGFEQPSAVETVDIAPSLAALIGLNVPDGTFDGRCLDLDAGPGTTCGAKP
ncbi:alkaline phosphatase family protein [Novosphingobium cyanobacteriorum]|uniref:Alkaline phosphatase n=1 Tax=Novosphingobium cyanobacteriorum TaxID=3024215 RepID=A0ABT6CJR1_9SPHN|nr:alkaline phosphatase family protein [Novosphingobium cyanobacteriorum]MDF8334161.1 alkaline phosphatase family protein [Novosphingobium cyanobacteriorum]